MRADPLGASDVATRAPYWPPLSYPEWKDTCATLHMWTQMVGKTLLALAPPAPHWWHVTLRLSACGLTTPPMPVGRRSLEVEFDFVSHTLVMRTSAGEVRTLRLAPQTVADFYRAYMKQLHSLDIYPVIRPVPVEVVEAIPFPEDTTHASYDAAYAHRFWLILLQADRVLKQFQGRFLGKSSPVHFFWGSLDLAVSRFSGRPAPRHPGGFPNTPDSVMVEAYSHEVASAGFWPGNDAYPEPAFYAYAYPEPPGYADARIGPAAARYDPTMREFLLPYEAVRSAPSPDAAVLEFVQGAYETAADLAGWDRAAFERAAADDSSHDDYSHDDHPQP